MFHSIMLQLTGSEMPAIDKVFSISVLLTFAYFFWQKISAVEKKRDDDNAANQKRYEDLVANILVKMEERFTALSQTTTNAIQENSRVIEDNSTVIKSFTK